MICKDGFVVGVKDSEGNLVTKDGDTFRIPFGTEYSFMIKNNTYNRAGVAIFVDGTPIMGENKVTLERGAKIEIDRFCIDGDLEKGNKLKFVEKDNEEVQDPTSESNGNVEFKFYPEIGSRRKGVVPRGFRSISGGSLLRKSVRSIEPQSFAGGGTYSMNAGPSASADMGNISANVNALFASADHDSLEMDAEAIGATIEGSTSDQAFVQGSKLNIGDIASTVISFNLRGQVEKKDGSVENKYKSKVAFILDKSGSMSSIRNETIKAFNEQRKVLLESPENVETSVSLFTFSWSADEPVLFDVPISDLRELTSTDYHPDGSTSMLDSVGMAVERLSALEDAHEENTSFLLIIISDGYENSSSTYDYEDVANLICSRQNTGRWTVTYLGANQNLAEISEKMKIDKGNIQIFNADSAGMKDASGVVAAGTKAYTSGLSGGIKCSKGFYSDENE